MWSLSTYNIWIFQKSDFEFLHYWAKKEASIMVCDSPCIYNITVLLYYIKWDTLPLLITVYLTRVQMFNYKERPYKDMPFAVYLPTHIIHYTHRCSLSQTRKSRQLHKIRREVFMTSPTAKWNVRQQNSDIFMWYFFSL